MQHYRRLDLSGRAIRDFVRHGVPWPRMVITTRQSRHHAWTTAPMANAPTATSGSSIVSNLPQSFAIEYPHEAVVDLKDAIALEFSDCPVHVSRSKA